MSKTLDFAIDTWIVSELAEEGPCEWCGAPIELNDPVFEVGQGLAFGCSRSCAELLRARSIRKEAVKP